MLETITHRTSFFTHDNLTPERLSHVNSFQSIRGHVQGSSAVGRPGTANISLLFRMLETITHRTSFFTHDNLTPERLSHVNSFQSIRGHVQGSSAVGRPGTANISLLFCMLETIMPQTLFLTYESILTVPNIETLSESEGLYRIRQRRALAWPRRVCQSLIHDT